MFSILRILRTLRKFSFDEVIDLYHVGSVKGALKMGALFLTLKATEKIGHDAYGFGLFLTRGVPADFFEHRHFATSMAKLTEFAGGVPDERGIEVFGIRTANRDVKTSSTASVPTAH